MGGAAEGEKGLMVLHGSLIHLEDADLIIALALLRERLTPKHSFSLAPAFQPPASS